MIWKRGFEKEKARIIQRLRDYNIEGVINSAEIWGIDKYRAIDINTKIVKGFMENRKALDVLIELIEQSKTFEEALYSVQQFVAFVTTVVPIILQGQQLLKRDDKEFG